MWSGNFVGLVPGTLAAFLVGGLIADLGFDPIDAGILGSGEMIVLAATSTFLARYMTRLPVVPISLAGGLLTGTAHLVSAFLEPFWPLLAVRLLAGVGEGLMLAAAAATAARTRDPDRVYGIGFAATMAALIAFSPVLGSVIGAYGMIGGYTAVGLLYLALTPLSLWLGLAPPRSATPASAFRPLPRGQLALVMIVMVSFGIGPAPTFAFLERVASEIGIDPGRVGAIFSMSFAVGLGTALFVGWLGPRWGRTLPTALALAALGTFSLLLVKVEGQAIFAWVLLAYMAWYLFVQVAYFAAVAAFDPSGRVAPAASGCFMLTLGLGPLVGGLLVTWGSYTATGWFGLTVCCFGALLLVTAGRFLDHLEEPGEKSFPS